MQTILVISEADEQRLRSILDSIATGPRPTALQRLALEDFLSRARTSGDAELLESRVAFYDHVSLESPVDPRDSFDLQPVMPSESDIDRNLIPVVFPVSLSVLGRRRGDQVRWETPAGERLMRIVGLRKAIATAG